MHCLHICAQLPLLPSVSVLHWEEPGQERWGGLGPGPVLGSVSLDGSLLPPRCAPDLCWCVHVHLWSLAVAPDYKQVASADFCSRR